MIEPQTETPKPRKLSMVEAKFEAQKIAFGPIFFQTLVAMRDLGVLKYISEKRGKAEIPQIALDMNLSKYAIDIMIEAAVVMGVVELEDDRAKITVVGSFWLLDEMTKVNVNFVSDVCYEGARYMKESLEESRPAGLKVLGDWPTVYEGLAHLPKPVRKSWLEFDHFYSQNAFDAALEIVFADKPKYIFDIGGNTGKWSIKCCEHDDEVRVKILDLPGQLEMAEKNIKERGFSNRVDGHHINVLDASQKVPKGADVIWMSQFLDCFSESEISVILDNCRQASTSDTFIYIMEPFIDNQKFPAAEFCLVGTSLYFTSIANGNSKMYKIRVMRDLVDKAGLKIVEEFPLVAEGFHTILKCALK